MPGKRGAGREGVGAGRCQQNETIRPGEGNRGAGFINSKGLEGGRETKGSQTDQWESAFLRVRIT